MDHTNPSSGCLGGSESEALASLGGQSCRTHSFAAQTSYTAGEPLSFGLGWGRAEGGDAHKALAKDWTMAFISQQNPNGLQT